MADIHDNIVWPGWETVGLLGRGNFGAVYEIERDMLGEKEKAALKVITIPQSSSDIDELYGEGYDDASITSTFQTYLKNIVAEYSLMRKMNGSANVVNCDDIRYVQHDDGIGWDIFIKMELLTPLTKSLEKSISDEQVAQIGADICKALILCNKHNIIHRDIKPANIFVSENGDYKLGDFGIAKTVEKTSGGTKIGTYEYMAPEVYHDQPYGRTVDIYSLGMVLYWLLNERRTPFLKMPPSLPTSTEKEQARKRRFGGEPIPAPAHGSDELKRIVLKACAFDPKDRYQSAEEMLSDINSFAGNAGSRISDRGAIEQDNSTSAVNTHGEKNQRDRAVASRARDTYEDATVSARHQEPHADCEEETVGVFAGTKPQVEIPKTENKRGNGIIPILAAIAAVLMIAVVLFFGLRNRQEDTGNSMISAEEPTAEPTEEPVEEPEIIPSEDTNTPPTPSESSDPEPVQESPNAETTDSDAEIAFEMDAFKGSIDKASRIMFSDATASSVYSELNGFSYPATNAIQDNVSWPWVEGASGDGTGENIILSFQKSETINLLGLHLGFSSVYQGNNRPRKLQFDFSDGSSVQYEFEDFNQMQYVQLSYPVTTNFVRITILSVYPSNMDNDAAITAVHAFYMPE